MASRFIYNNLITAESMFTVSSLKTGVVSDALKIGTGSAVITTSGNYSGTTDLEYIVEIDSIAGGAEVGQATFKWSDGGGGWDATGVTTSATNILLNNGVYIKHTTGAGADFVVGDKWYFKGINMFAAGKMIDSNRDTRYRSAALGAPNKIILDLGAAVEVKALVIYDHNITSGATLMIEGRADAWVEVAPTLGAETHILSLAVYNSKLYGGTFPNGKLYEANAVLETISYNANKIVHYLTSATTKRHWRLSVTDAANTDSYIEIGELYLASYFELSNTFAWGPGRQYGSIIGENKTSFGVKKRRYFNRQNVLGYHWNRLADADITSLETMLEAIGTQSTGVIKPVIWNPETALPGVSYMVEFDGFSYKEVFTGIHRADMTMVEVLKSV